jgi:hypothetical protein
MSVIKQFDQIAYYYTFEYYLHEQELDYTVLDYAQNNGIEFGSLICFFDVIKDNVHYIVTTDEKKSHKLISIFKFSSVNNLILNNIIYYNSYKFTIYDNMSLLDIENLIGIFCDDKIVQTHVNKRNPFRDGINLQWQDYNFKYREYTFYIRNLRILSVLTNCAHVECADFKNSQAIELNVAKLDMVKLFPNLKTITNYNCKIIYQRKTK